ncbi:MAG TPA: OB-fold domain-containing protein [Acidimicrobiales bacterium]|jgi:uncharacterized OB-fold protein|nr:OB-fold domain-containing protein [Acidimicrobiales bacterium]MDP6214375.1 OB-fold domain-containing protein [Acidimicrobiales bacterium]MDP7210020.1 OB-fold domain-containing protein [Acidimicrobiales bacterium]HJL89373.1 OB-fold domain-containing protein [Acidimicrobiales bacterium]HJO98574.1 OB-fold domain-containing protein [Acidimicrobiales bacterium]|tara:strand:+ start:9174 stop:9575 length:402 start_codon:yes stop_codon:yes gene_type:complete
MATTQQVPIVNYLRVGARPYLRAQECVGCGARYFDRRNACAKCGQAEFVNARVSNHGVLRSFSIVHRAAPGIPVPYVSALVETDDGTTVRSNLVDCPADPGHVTLGMKVRLATYVSGTDDAGTECVAFGYRPT